MVSVLDMNKTKSPIAFALVCIIAAGLTGCAAFEKCSPENCATDAQIKKDVDAMLVQHREFGPPAAFHMQTINGVVYMNGTVNSDFEMRNMETFVRQINNVKDVVNNLSVRSNSR
jgi:osmotically-inducible protein OsmY